MVATEGDPASVTTLLTKQQRGADFTSSYDKEKAAMRRIPGHHGIAGNVEADACAKQAAAITDSAPRPFSFAAASAPIR